MGTIMVNRYRPMRLVPTTTRIASIPAAPLLRSLDIMGLRPRRQRLIGAFYVAGGIKILPKVAQGMGGGEIL
ncbi:hypothetical protein RYZ20_04435 [Thioclava sp. A2]|uniref:hypothetical protein n=1 Tax=Thioclava sp. FCG-A2 TaxID=3080562 RepID=UPI002953FAE7|nr:hypothetical protein [Thioclava sp. A2]MDV7270147.1 hypothetical protein [Thioclava sp. A2]